MTEGKKTTKSILTADLVQDFTSKPSGLREECEKAHKIYRANVTACKTDAERKCVMKNYFNYVVDMCYEARRAQEFDLLYELNALAGHLDKRTRMRRRTY